MKLLKFDQFLAESIKSTDEYESVNEASVNVKKALKHIKDGIGWAADSYVHELGGPMGLKAPELKDLAIESF
jgi:hypothetical protein